MNIREEKTLARISPEKGDSNRKDRKSHKDQVVGRPEPYDLGDLLADGASITSQPSLASSVTFPHPRDMEIWGGGPGTPRPHSTATRGTAVHHVPLQGA